MSRLSATSSRTSITRSSRDLIQKLNQTSVAGMLDPDFLGRSADSPIRPPNTNPQSLDRRSPSTTLDIDVDVRRAVRQLQLGALYHIPVMIAVHLRNNQRFAEAQNWFHLVFDPTNTDPTVPHPAALVEVASRSAREQPIRASPT